MQAGRMKYRLTLLRPVTDEDTFGSAPSDFEEVRTVWAERVKMSGNRTMEVGESFPDYRTEFNIRIKHPIDNNWRVQQLGGYLYNVTNIIPNIDRGYQTIVCERVNE